MLEPRGEADLALEPFGAERGVGAAGEQGGRWSPGARGLTDDRLARQGAPRSRFRSVRLAGVIRVERWA